MAQHDQVIANQSASAVRADINSALAALFSNSSSTNGSQPSPTVAYQFWADGQNGIMKMRNGANSGWINLYTLDGVTDYLGDANFYTTIDSSVPRLQFDTNDFISYDRSTNTYSFNVGTTSYAKVDGNGLVTSQVRVADTSYGYALNADATSSFLSFAANDFFAFDRSTNTLRFLLGGVTIFSFADGFGSIDSAGGAGGRLKSSNSSNSMRLGYAAPYPTIAVDNTAFQIASPSDIKLKQNIEDLSLDDAWQQVQAMRPVSFEWIQGPSGRQPGVIAQEMEVINPGFVLPPTEGFDPQEQVMQLNTSAIIATLTAALQQAMARIEALEQQAA
jgi:hypothetical protein